MSRTIKTGVSPGWRSLLTFRWHRSSWGVVAAVLLFLVFCNVPGQLTPRIPSLDEASQMHLLVQPHEHGWPFAWAVRGDGSWIIPDVSKVSCWTFWTHAPKYRWHALAANLVIAGALSLAAGMVFEAWRRDRIHIWQWYLRDLLAALFAISLAGAWYAAAQHRYANEKRVLGGNRDRPLDYIEGWDTPIHGIYSGRKTIGGITWLRGLVGDPPFQFLDRTVVVSVDREGLPWAAQLPDVRVLSVFDDLTSSDITCLEELPQLEFLSIDRPLESSLDEPRKTRSAPRLTMPRLFHVRTLDTTDINWDGLTNLPALETILWRGEPVDRERMQQFAALPSLRELRLRHCEFFPADLSLLRPRQSLQMLSLARPLETDDLRTIGQLTQLTELKLSGCTFEPAAISQLAPLVKLESLDLMLTPVTDEGLQHLPSFPRLRELDLSGTKVTSRSIELLASRTGLNFLFVNIEYFTSQEQDRMRAALPECRIGFTQISTE